MDVKRANFLRRFGIKMEVEIGPFITEPLRVIFGLSKPYSNLTYTNQN